MAEKDKDPQTATSSNFDRLKTSVLSTNTSQISKPTSSKVLLGTNSRSKYIPFQMQNMACGPVKGVQVLKQQRIKFPVIDRRVELVAIINKDCWSCLETAIGYTSEMKLQMIESVNFAWIIKNASKLSDNTGVPIILASVRRVLAKSDHIVLEDNSGVFVAAVNETVPKPLRAKLVPGTCICLVQCSLLTEGSTIILAIGEENIICIASKEDFDDDDLYLPTLHDYVFFKKKNVSGVSLLQFATVDWPSTISGTNVLIREFVDPPKTSSPVQSNKSDTGTDLATTPDDSCVFDDEYNDIFSSIDLDFKF